MRQRGRVFAFALLLVVSAVAIPFAGAADGGSMSPVANSSDYTFENLRNSGQVVDDRFPSLRVMDESSAFWLVRYPPSGLNKYGGENAKKEFLTPTTTVRRNKVRVFATHPFDGETRQYDVKVVYWHPETKSVQTENGTTTERVANVTGVSEQKLEFQSGFQQADDLRLRPHYDSKTRVTVIWPSGERVTFRHKSIATAQPVNIDNKNDLYSWIGVWILLPTLIVVILEKKTIPPLRRAAKAGTGHSPWFWIIPGFIAAFGCLAWGYTAFASLIAAVPLVIPFAIGWVLAAYDLEDDEDMVEHWGFIRLSDIQKSTSPLDDKTDILDSGEIEVKGYDIVETDDGPALYHDGILPMWARFKGKFATIDIRNKEAEWEAEGDYDKVVIVDNDVDDLINHKRERVVFAWPWRTYSTEDKDDDEIDHALANVLPEEIGKPQYIQMVGMAVVVGGAALASRQFIGHWIWGVIACLPGAFHFAEAIDGWAHTSVAPGQARKAWTTSWYTNLNLKRFGTVDELTKMVIQLENRQYAPKKWIQQAKEEGLIESAHKDDPFESDLMANDPAFSDEDSRRSARGDD